jgi:hypothetical protein
VPITAFDPRLDHVDVGAAWRATQADEARVAEVLERAANDAAGLLRRSFEAAFDAHRMSDRLREAGELHLAPALRPDRAAALAAVDHFATRTRVPRLPAAGQPRGPRHDRLNAFLWSRLETWLKQDGAETLSWDAVLRWIPDPWIPVERFTRTLERAARAHGYGDVAIAFDLKPPGGARWLRERTLEAWTELRGHLDEGRPRPVDLFTEVPGAGPRVPSTVVVHGYELVDDKALTLYVYDPRQGPEERRLGFDLGAPVLAGSEGGAAAPSTVVRGFRCPTYVPARPPAFGWARLLRLLFLERLAWRIARRLALRDLRRAAPPALPAETPRGPTGATPA